MHMIEKLTFHLGMRYIVTNSDDICGIEQHKKFAEVCHFLYISWAEILLEPIIMKSKTVVNRAPVYVAQQTTKAR